MAIPSKRVSASSKDPLQRKSERNEEVLSKKSKRKEEEEEEDDDDDDDDDEDEDEEEDEDEGDEEEDADEDDEDDEEGVVDDEALAEDDEPDDDEPDDDEPDDDEPDDDEPDDDEPDDDEPDDTDLDDEDGEDEDFDDEDDEDEDDEDEDDDDDEDFDEDEKEEDESGSGGRRKRMATGAAVSKKATEEGRPPPEAGVEAAVVAGAVAGAKDATVKMKPVASSSSAKGAAGLTGSKRNELAGTRRYQKSRSDKLKIAMVGGCFLLAIACLVVGWIVIQQRFQGPPKPTEDRLEFNLGDRLNRQIAHGNKSSDEGKAALEKEDYVTAGAKLAEAVKVWESVVEQISKLRSKAEYSGDDFLGYEAKAAQVNQKIHDARQMLAVFEFRAIRKRVEQEELKNPSPTTKPEATPAGDGARYDPDYEEQVKRAKMKAELRKKEAEEKVAKENALADGAAEEPRKETPATPATPDAPAVKTEEQKEEPKVEEPAPQPAQKDPKGELKVDEFQP